MSILIVIPARGGSKGIPRKNLRPLYGKPLIQYSIEVVKKLQIPHDVVVSSEDEEILTIASKLGVSIIKREKELAKDTTTLDPVVYDAYTRASSKGKKITLIVTLQPTSPLLRSETLESAINIIQNDSGIDTLISVEDDTHLTWKEIKGEFIPNYKERINRQHLPKVFKETGGFLITRPAFISPSNRIGKRVSIFPLHRPESIDIDSHEDFQLCEYFLRRKKIVIVTNGNSKIGLGHVYNTLSIANELVDHNISFLVARDGDLAEEKIKQYNYSVIRQGQSDLASEVLALNPDLVINDLLDTTSTYVKKLKKSKCKVVNFEDLGSGARQADLIFNAIYPEKEKLPRHYFGHAYFILRDEFYLTQPNKINDKTERVLLTFGGVDSNNFTKKVLDSIYEYCVEHKIQIDVVAGMGYTRYQSLAGYPKISIHRNIKNISELISNADIAFTSAGRTTFEVAALGIPSIVLAQNEREATHLFASKKFGFEYLGPGMQLSNARLLRAFQRLATDYRRRKKAHEKMLSFGIRESKKRTISLIRNLIYEM